MTSETPLYLTCGARVPYDPHSVKYATHFTSPTNPILTPPMKGRLDALNGPISETHCTNSARHRCRQPASSHARPHSTNSQVNGSIPAALWPVKCDSGNSSGKTWRLSGRATDLAPVKGPVTDWRPAQPGAVCLHHNITALPTRSERFNAVVVRPDIVRQTDLPTTAKRAHGSTVRICQHPSTCRPSIVDEAETLTRTARTTSQNDHCTQQTKTVINRTQYWCQCGCISTKTHHFRL